MKRVLVTGCFDILHPGHIYLIKEAAKLGEVYVIVSRDSTTKKIKNQNPIVPENQRLEVVQALKDVKFAVLGNEGENYLQKAIELKPDIILLGPTQALKPEVLKVQLIKIGHPEIEVKRLSSFYDKCELSSSTAIKEKIKKNYIPNGNNISKSK